VGNKNFTFLFFKNLSSLKALKRSSQPPAGCLLVVFGTNSATIPPFKAFGYKSGPRSEPSSRALFYKHKIKSNVRETADLLFTQIPKHLTLVGLLEIQTGPTAVGIFRSSTLLSTHEFGFPLNFTDSLLFGTGSRDCRMRHDPQYHHHPTLTKQFLKICSTLSVAIEERGGHLSLLVRMLNVLCTRSCLQSVYRF
jgi:hypothetical protein